MSGVSAHTDDWRPSASIERLRARAQLLGRIRDFFDHLGVLEVETPVCSLHANTDPTIESLHSNYSGPGAPLGIPLYLHTSPEFAMKRLLAAGCGPIYQICKVFRDGELGRFHNPEFTMLEWYRPGYDHHQLMEEVEALVVGLFDHPFSIVRTSYQQLFQSTLGIDPHLCSEDELKRCAVTSGIPGIEALALNGRDEWLDLLMTHCIEPAMGPGLCFVYDYPTSQASLARIRPGNPAVAERFELYLDGVELANGFHELTDGEDQRQRFQADIVQRRTTGLTEVPMDRHLLNALESGMPSCAGVALGVDRLLMRLVGAEHIDQVLAFPLLRA